MSVDLLREAAETMRARAEEATGGRWWPRYGGEPGFIYSSGEKRLIATVEGESSDATPNPNSRHIASWHPAVALAVADWLDLADQEWSPSDLRESAKTVARAYLGRES